MKRYVLPALGFVAVVVAGCGRSSAVIESHPPLPALNVPVTVVAATPVGMTYEAVGTVRSDASATIQSKVSGHVTAVLVREGDKVSQGQVLVEIDDREASAQLRRAESALTEAQEARREVERSLQAAEHARQAAAADSHLAKTTHARYKGLKEQGVVSGQIYDEASARWKGAEAQAAQAGEAVAAVQARRGEAEARIQQAEAELTNVQTILSFTKVTAPFDGIVTRKTVDVGNLAAPGSPLLEVEATQQYRLEAQVDESALAGIKTGDKVGVVLNAAGSEELPGTVAEIVPAADESSRTFVVKVDLPQASAVQSGMFGRARFAMGQREILTVPASALTRRGQLTSVYVVGEDNVARLRIVTTGKTYGDRIEALSGLEAGERVVFGRVEQVVDGSPIAAEQRG